MCGPSRTVAAGPATSLGADGGATVRLLQLNTVERVEERGLLARLGEGEPVRPHD